MNNNEYLEQIQEQAVELMLDSTQSVEDRFAAMLLAMTTVVKQKGNQSSNNN